MQIACLVKFKLALHLLKTYGEPRPAGCEELKVRTAVPMLVLRFT